MDQKLKDKLDARRFRVAVAKGLDLGKVLEVVFGGREEALSGKRVGALAAFRRLEREIRFGRLPVKVNGKKHIPLSLLKGLVGEGYIRVERLELSSEQKRKELKRAPDPRLVGTAYQLTRKGRKLLQEDLQPEGEVGQATSQVQDRRAPRSENREGERQGQE
jgi:hypothetical protein